MKKFIASVALVSLATFYLPSCKKSDKQQTTIEKIQGKWQLESDIYNDHFSGQDNIDSITGDPGDIVDFRTDGKVYSNIGGFTDTSAYALSGDTKIVLDAIHIYDIVTLTANSFIINNKETNGPSDFTEETITLKK